MSLTDADIERYSRQIILPGVGARGQRKLLDARVAVLGERSGVNAARRYLAAAGVRSASHTDSRLDVLLLCDGSADDVRAAAAARERSVPVVWYVIEDNSVSSAVTPPAPLPAPVAPAASPLDTRREHAAANAVRTGRRRAAACEAAAVVAAIICGLDFGTGKPTSYRL